MNDFARVEDTLEMLKKQKDPTLEDVLGLYLDLCEDIEANGQEIDNLKIEKTENLLKNLSRSGRIFSEYYPETFGRDRGRSILMEEYGSRKKNFRKALPGFRIGKRSCRHP